MDDELRDLEERQASALEWIAASLERLADVAEAIHGKPDVETGKVSQRAE